MTYHQAPYSDAASAQEMSADCYEVEHNLHITHERTGEVAARSAEHAGASAASRLHSHYEVSDDLARRASGLELHFD